MSGTSLAKRVFDAYPDTIDFRDRMYEPTLVEVPEEITLDEYRKVNVPILDQGQEGACTGFGLATIANFLLRNRAVRPDKTAVSTRMLYEMAKRYDVIPGDKYEGSTARAAMKGWHKHGVCSEELWKYVVDEKNGTLTLDRARDAVNRPLGAYFRVNHKDLVAMHSALAEVRILYVTADVHSGWGAVGKDGVIKFDETSKKLGGHAFAIVAYDKRGFWIQNSWGDDWGMDGFAHIPYQDWLQNGKDVWVARLGVPILKEAVGLTVVTRTPGARQSEAYSFSDLRPHIINIGNNGKLRSDGTYGTSEDDVAQIILEDIPRLTKGWTKKRIFLYAHGGLVSETSFLQRVAEYRSAMIDYQIYPLAFIWNTDLWSTVTNIVQDALKQRRPEGVLGPAMDFMLDRLDNTLEVIIRTLRVKATWDEMKENAFAATTEPLGGARIVLKYLAQLVQQFSNSPNSVEINMAGHSAGSIFLAPLVKLLTTEGTIKSGTLASEQGLGIKVNTCALWAPGITIADFKDNYLQAIQNRRIRNFSLFTLSDETEQDDHVANIYHKSLLYLVSNALEPLPDTPLLGLEKHVRKDKEVADIFKRNGTQSLGEWVISPNKATLGSLGASRADHHGQFDDDPATLKATMARILPVGAKLPDFDFHRSASSLRDRRLQLK